MNNKNFRTEAKELLDKNMCELNEVQKTLGLMASLLEQYEKKLAEAEEALKFYADGKDFSLMNGNKAMSIDIGTKAREYLNKEV